VITMQATQPIPLRTFSPPKLGLAAVLALTAAIAGGILVTQLAWSPASDAGAAGAGLLEQRAGERALGGDAAAGLVQQRAGERAIGGHDPDPGFVQQRIGERTLGQGGSAAGQPSTDDHVSGHGFSGYR
jgi:hypothetical protein